MSRIEAAAQCLVDAVGRGSECPATTQQVLRAVRSTGSHAPAREPEDEPRNDLFITTQSLPTLRALQDGP